jgi:hypothetical protein
MKNWKTFFFIQYSKKSALLLYITLYNFFYEYVTALHCTHTAQSGDLNPNIATFRPSARNGATSSLSLESLYIALKMFSACT